jgi:hypothetical protein
MDTWELTTVVMVLLLKIWKRSKARKIRLSSKFFSRFLYVCNIHIYYCKSWNMFTYQFLIFVFLTEKNDFTFLHISGSRPAQAKSS